MELAVGLFVRLGDALDLLDNIEGAEHIDIDFGGVADKPHDGLSDTVCELRLDAHFVKPSG